MDTHLIITIARRLMSLPAAPYHESLIVAEVKKLCREHGLEFAQDSFGNSFIQIRNGGRRRPLVLAAHLDHPGFEIVKRIAPDKFLGRFLGGVPDAFFKKGTLIRLFPGNDRALLGKRVGREKDFEIKSSRRLVVLPAFAVWDLENFRQRRDRIYGSSCDDLIGAAAVLATLIDLKQRKVKTNALGVLSRAEEVGFHGALMVAESKQIPDNALVISLETSREMPPVKMGEGVIVRVGDRSSIFDSAATRFLSEVAGQIKNADKNFKFQRALMSGGTCEGTAYQEYGCQTAAVCVALGNYHNCGANARIAPEFVNVQDATSMARLLSEAATRMNEYETLATRLPKRLEALAKEARQEFRKRR